MKLLKDLIDGQGIFQTFGSAQRSQAIAPATDGDEGWLLVGPISLVANPGTHCALAAAPPPRRGNPFWAVAAYFSIFFAGTRPLLRWGVIRDSDPPRDPFSSQPPTVASTNAWSYSDVATPRRPIPGSFSAGRRISRPSTAPKKLISMPSTQPILSPR
jgi:hypothetical protein